MAEGGTHSWGIDVGSAVMVTKPQTKLPEEAPGGPPSSALSGPSPARRQPVPDYEVPVNHYFRILTP